MVGEYVVSGRVYRIAETGLITYSGLECGDQEGQPRGMKVGCVERMGKRFKVSCFVMGLPPATRLCDSHTDAIGIADVWMEQHLQKVELSIKHKPIFRDPTPYEDLLNERLMTPEAIDEGEERDRKRAARAPKEELKVPDFQELARKVMRQPSRIQSWAPQAIPAEVPAPAARIPSAGDYTSKGTTQVEPLWFMREPQKPPKKRQYPSKFHFNSMTDPRPVAPVVLAVIGGMNPTFISFDDPPTPPAVPGKPSWLPDKPPLGFSAVYSALKHIGRPYPAPAHQPRLLTQPERLLSHPTIIDQVGDAARFKGVTPPPPKIPSIMGETIHMSLGFFLPLWEFPWLEDDGMRERLVEAIILVLELRGEKDRFPDICEQIERREVEYMLVKPLQLALQMARAWGVNFTSTPVVPPPAPPVKQAPAPVVTAAAEWPHCESSYIDALVNNLHVRAAPRTPALANRRLEWTEAEDSFLRENYGSRAMADIATLMNRTEAGVRIRAKKIGLSQKRALARKEIYPATAIARALKVDQKCVTWWAELGLKVQDSAISAGVSHCKVVSMTDLVAFLNERPELFEPHRVDVQRLHDMGGVLAPQVMMPQWRWKRLVCPAAEHHATELPLAFLAPLHDIQPYCPACGRKLGRQAVGTLSERYKRNGRALDHWQLLTKAGARMLRIIADAGGRSDITRVADAYRGGIAENDEMQVTRKVLTRMTTKQLPMLICDAQPVKGSRKSEPRIFFQITPAGRSALEMLRLVNMEQGTAPPMMDVSPVESDSEAVETIRHRKRTDEWSRNGKPWEADEEIFLRTAWKNQSIHVICLHLHRSSRSVTQHARVMGLPRRYRHDR